MLTSLRLAAKKQLQHTRARQQGEAFTRDLFAINVERIFTDVDGVIIAKTDPSITAPFQTQLPVYLFGAFDRNGGNAIAQKVLPAPAGVYNLGTFVYGSTVPPFLALSGLNEIIANFKFGDIITVFTDSISAPTFFCWIIQNTPEAPLNSLMADAYNADPITVRTINYVVDSLTQFNQALHFTRATRLGKYTDNSVDVLAYKTPNYRLNDFVEIPVSFDITPYIGIQFYLEFGTDLMQLVFNVEV